MFSAATKTGSQPATGAANYIEDVFSTYLYTGNGSTQTIVNGIQLGDTTTGGSQNFFPANSYSQLSTSSAMNFGTSDWTIEFFYQGSPNSFGVAFEIFTSGVNTQLISIQRNGTGADAIYVQNASIVLTTSGATPWDGAWHHHAVVRNGGTVTYYIDGVSRGTYSTSLNLTGSNTVRIGNYSAIPGYGINGYLSNLRVVSGTAVYTSTFTPPTSALTAISGTQLLTCQSPSPFTDNSTNAFAISAYNAAGSGIQGPFSPTVAGKGGMVWIKARSVAYNNVVFDTVRGTLNSLRTNQTAAQSTDADSLTAFNSNGFSLGSAALENINTGLLASWTFRKQPKFFDVVTFTQSGTSGYQTINHNLGSTPGMIFIKGVGQADGWFVYHRSIPTQVTYLNQTNAAANYTLSNSVTSTTFNFNLTDFGWANGATYVAYLFAHNAGGFGTSGTDNVISCGSYTGTGSAQTISLGYEPQYVLIKQASGANAWNVWDVMRGMPVGGTDPYLQPNSSSAEDYAGSYDFISPTATGMVIDPGSNGYNYVNTSGETYIYMAIRRPMKVPTDATTVFSPITSADVQGTQQTTGFVIDSQWNAYRPSTISSNTTFVDRLRGVSSTTTSSGVSLISSSTAAETTANNVTQYWNNTGFQTPEYLGSSSSIYYSFSRRPGFFDEVCFNGQDTDFTVSHNLQAVPELIILKKRNASGAWFVGGTIVGFNESNNNNNLFLNNTNAISTSTLYTAPWTSSAMYMSGAVNFAAGSTAVAYLFATCPGVSKVGSYTGTGANQTINCGFTGGARFVMIKRTDSNGGWYVWDTARGMVAGTDPSMQLNSSASESNVNYVYTATTGFQIVTSVSPINTSGGTYIYLAIA